jgi:ligand-binding sensor domain-containing protein/two-component sensor histidine kinase
MRKLLLVLSIFVCGQIVLGQSYSFISYSTSEGLPQSQVTSITQDGQGYLWVGTLSGLAKFNGTRFISYSTENGLRNNRVTSLTHIDEELWIGHEGGVSRMINGKATGWQFRSEHKSAAVTQVTRFGDAIVISTNGGGLYFLKDGKLGHMDLPESDANRCRDLTIVGDRLFIATRGGIYSTADLRTSRWEKAAGRKSVSGFARSAGQFLISTYSEGLFRADKDLKRLDSIPLKAGEYNIKKAIVDSREQVWLSSVFGIIRISSNGGQLLLDESNGLPVSSANCVFEDREGNIWVGSEGKGLLRFTGEQFVYYNTRNGFPTDQVLSVTKNNSVYFFGSYDKSVFSRTAAGQVQFLKIPGVTVWSMEFDNFGNLWCGTNVGLSAYEPSGKVRNFTMNDVEGRFTIVRRLANRSLIAGGSDGMGWIRNGSFEPIKLVIDHESTIGTARDFAWFNQQLYCASDKGLFEINTRTGLCRSLHRFPAGLTSLSIDGMNRLWIGTENGLYVFDGVKFSALSTGTSSGSRFVNFQQLVGSRMYVGTNNGLYVYNCENEEIVLRRRYGINDGLINLESNINSAFYDGTFLWFGTAEGLVRLDVRKAETNKEVKPSPLLNITGILLNYQPFDYAQYSDKLDRNGLPQSLELPYYKNNISIDLDGMMLSNPSALRYQFWLEGLDDGWSPMIANPSIVLSNLPSGNFRLHLRTIYENGYYSEEILLPISITPPFWRTWWFYALIAIGVILGIRRYFLLRIRKERERNYKENLENKTRLLALEQQSLNASMNRHFIFNSLNSIQYFINTQDRLSANRYLTSFAKLIRKNLDTASENDNMVTLHQELERLELYLQLEAMRFKDRFNYAIDTDDIDTEALMVPAMLLQPFVENSIIHGILPNEQKKGEIRVTLRRIGNSIEILLSDNGVGIDYSMKQKESFSGDHKSQGMEITSKRIDLIRKMWKKDYELFGPYQVFDSDHSIKGTHVLIKIPAENLE